MTTATLTAPRVVAPALGGGAAAVWLLPESGVDALAEAAGADRVLPPEALARVRATRTPRARRHCLGARLLSRLVLARYAGEDPSVLRFVTGRYGRPELDGPYRLRFNLSHTDGLLACVVTRGVPCGVDVQAPVPASAVPHLARAFPPAARRRLESVPVDGRPRALLELWTAAEAYGKALGIGLRHADRIDLRPGPAGELTVHDPDAPPGPWRLHTRHLDTGHTLAVAVRHRGPADGPALSLVTLVEGALP